MQTLPREQLGSNSIVLSKNKAVLMWQYLYHIKQTHTFLSKTGIHSEKSVMILNNYQNIAKGMSKRLMQTHTNFILFGRSIEEILCSTHTNSLTKNHFVTHGHPRLFVASLISPLVSKDVLTV